MLSVAQVDAASRVRRIGAMLSAGGASRAERAGSERWTSTAKTRPATTSPASTSSTTGDHSGVSTGRRDPDGRGGCGCGAPLVSDGGGS